MNMHNHIAFAAMLALFLATTMATKHCRPRSGLWEYVPRIYARIRHSSVMHKACNTIRKTCRTAMGRLQEKDRDNGVKDAGMLSAPLAQVMSQAAGETKESRDIECPQSCMAAHAQRSRNSDGSIAHHPAGQAADHADGTPACPTAEDADGRGDGMTCHDGSIAACLHDSRTYEIRRPSVLSSGRKGGGRKHRRRHVHDAGTMLSKTGARQEGTPYTSCRRKDLKPGEKNAFRHIQKK